MNSPTFRRSSPALLLLSCFSGAPLFAGLLIRTTDGRSLRAAVSRHEVRSIELENEARPAPQASAAGTWGIVFSGGFRTTLALEQLGDAATGALRISDQTPGGVTGASSGGKWTLSRGTGLQAIQKCRLPMEGNRIKGATGTKAACPAAGPSRECAAGVAYSANSRAAVPR